MHPQSGLPHLRCAFAGTPAFAVPVLEAMIEQAYAPLAVLTQPDRPAGRGRKPQATPVKRAATRHGIRVLQPARLAAEPAQAALRELDLDLLVVVAYGLILPRSVLDIPRLGCWNVHASLLPRWRGAAPVQRAIEAGDSETGACVMQMDQGLDTGPVLLARRTKITARDTGGTLHDRLAQLGASALMECLQKLRDGALPPPSPQNNERATYARKLTKSEAQIDWHDAAIVLERRVRAFSPWPVCWCEIGGQRLRIWAVEAVPAVDGPPPGTLVAATARGIDIATSSGVLRLLEVQPPGGKRMPAGDYLNAHPLTPTP
jgi:methionyl-tRNA formyltransferase